MVVKINEIIFDPRVRGPNSVIRKSKLVWLPISYQARQLIIFKAKKGELTTQDKPVDLDEVTEL